MNMFVCFFFLCSFVVSGLLMFSVCGKYDVSNDMLVLVSIVLVMLMLMILVLVIIVFVLLSIVMILVMLISIVFVLVSIIVSVVFVNVDVFVVSKVVVGDVVMVVYIVSQVKDIIVVNQKVIYVSVEINGCIDGVILSVCWSYDEGKGQLVSVISQLIVIIGLVVIMFKIQNLNVWLVGKYKVEIVLDGKFVLICVFEVKFLI